MGNPAQHRTKKRFGQHFLHDQQVIKQIINAVQISDGQTLVEIGPGEGAITMPLLQKFNQLTAIELDRDLIHHLSQKSKLYGELNLINSDILNIDFESEFANKSLSVVGNLPYNISTPLLFHLMKFNHMIKQEVANRITASVGDKSYGRLSIMMQYYCRCDYLFHVPPESFNPPPKVDSAVILLTPHAEQNTDLLNKPLFDDLVKTAFSQRRKTIRNSLSKMVEAKHFELSAINPKLRAENLSLEQFITLSNTVHNHA